jgi:putative oxidoreductase
MKEVIKQYFQKISPNCHDESGENYAYTVFRLVVSAMFFMHGAQKFFGLFGGLDGLGSIAPFASLIWFAAVIEAAVGMLIFIGMFTRLAAALAVVEMISAYFIGHFPNGVNPLLNGGELAIMYAVSFLVILRYGGGKLSLEKKYCKSEFF